MPKYQRFDHQALAAVFRALGDPTRVAVVERLSIGPASTTELARPFAMTLPSFVQHLGVLEAAGIVRSQKQGRVRIFQLAAQALEPATSWMGTHRNHWERRLDQLDEVLASPPDSTHAGIPATVKPNQEQAP